MYGTKWTYAACLAFTAMALGESVPRPGSSAPALNIPQNADAVTTLQDVQNRAYGLIDRVVGGVTGGDTQALNSAFDDGITYYMAERNLILSNIPALMSTVGVRAKAAADSLSSAQITSLTNSFQTWASGGAGRGDLISKELGSAPLLSSAVMSFAPAETAAAKATADTASSSPVTASVTTGSGALAPVLSGVGPATPSGRGLLDAASAADKASSGEGGETSVALAEDRFFQDINPQRGSLHGLFEQLRQDSAGARGANRAPATTTSGVSAAGRFTRPPARTPGTETTDLILVRCYKMPARAPVPCRPGLAQLCLNGIGQPLPCP